MRRSLIAASAAVLTLQLISGLAASETRRVRVEAGDHDRKNTPVKLLIELPADQAEVSAVCIAADGTKLPAQITAPGLLAEKCDASDGMVVREVHFIAPSVAAGETADYTLKLGESAGASDDAFAWTNSDGKSCTLSFGDQPVLRYMHEAIDESLPERRELTFKPFHHVFDPASGEQIVTKGPGGRYTHHRGLFFGFNKCRYGDGRQADVWHCRGDAFQSHEDFLAQETGPVLGRQRVAIDWHGQDKEVFAQEERELTVYSVPGGRLIEFASIVRPVDGAVRLDGDPQHAGFHFRASNEVADKTYGETYYLRPDGRGGKGETRNWPDNKDHVNLPWNAMSFVLGGQRYTAVYLDRPQNPKESRFSERDYGRFGSYFEYDMTEDAPLAVNYRVWLQADELDGDAAAALDAEFVEPPQASIDN